MKLEIQCDIETNARIEEEIRLEHAKRSYVFHPNEDQILCKISIICNVENPKKFYSEIKHRPGAKVPTKFIVNSDKELYDSVIRDFQEIESRMSPILGMKKVHWESAKYKLIIENEEERKKTKISSWNLVEKSNEDVVLITRRNLESMLKSKLKCQPLILPLSFYREGANEISAKRYINAFFNFYFVLEGLFGNGKTKNHAVLNEFKNSKVLCKVTKSVITDNVMVDPRDRSELTKMLSLRNKSFDVSGILELIVRTRGGLHHFTNSTGKVEGTPFTHKEFKSISFLLMVICFLVLVSYFSLHEDVK